MLKPLFYTISKNNLQCLLCPNYCTIKNHNSGICKVRYNNSGKLEIPFAGRISALAVDPVEKKPLYHFFPGKNILSAGFYGCSFKCPFCQNYSISSSTRDDAELFQPAEMLETVIKSGTIGLAYTYSEPIVHIEWVRETSLLLRDKNLKNVLITNGYINPEPAAYLLEYLDAANIDLKSFNPDFYKKELKGNIEPVKEFIKIASEKIHIEITTLVIPGKNDSPEEIKEIAGFISGINRKIPLHLSCYYPAYNYTIPAAGSETILKLAETASAYLDYVYPGNIGLRDNSTYCAECRNILIKRAGYNTYIAGLTADSRCSSCGANTNIVVQ